MLRGPYEAKERPRREAGARVTGYSDGRRCARGRASKNSSSSTRSQTFLAPIRRGVGMSPAATIASNLRVEQPTYSLAVRQFEIG